jgi:DNA-binding transcriptional LysR family regulator
MVLWMRTIDLESLKIFRTVVDEGGIVRAANKLHRVQSNVTTRIRHLEEHLGTRLFRRDGRSIRLSAEGQILLTYTDRLLRLADETVSEMRNGKPKGVFRLGALESTAGQSPCSHPVALSQPLSRRGGGTRHRNYRGASDPRSELPA